MRKLAIFRVAVLFLAVIGGTAAQAASYFTAITNLHPVLYFPLNETVPPPSVKPAAANLGTLGSADNGTYTDGAFPGVPGALVGDPDTAGLFSGASGVNPRVTTPYDANYATDAVFTIELWLNSAVQDPPESSPVNCLDVASPRAGWLIFVDATAPGTFNFRPYIGNSTTIGINPGVGYNIPVPGGHILSNTWYHLAITFNGTNAQGYVNGVAAPVSSAMTANYVPSTAGAFTIGARSDSSFAFPGFIDEVALYSSLLSATDISNHYAAGISGSAGAYLTAVTSDHPQLYFRLDEAQAPVAVNYGTAGAFANGYYETGTAPGATPGSPLPTGLGSVACAFTSGQSADIGQSVVVLGAAGLPVGINSNNPITFTLWALAGSPPGYFTTVAGKGDQSYRFDLNNGSGVPHWNAGNVNEIAAGPSVANNNWHFWAGTWDGTNIENLYIDGVLVGQATGNLGPNGNTDPFLIGTAPDDGGRNFEGYIAQVAVFPTALSQSQVQGLYFGAGLPPVITLQPLPSVVLAGSNISFTVSAIGAAPLSYSWQVGGGGAITVGNASGTNTPTLTITGATPADTNTTYQVVVTDGNGNSVASQAVPLSVLTSSLAGSYFPAVIGLNPLGYWPMNETNLPPASAVATNYGTLGSAGDAAYSSTGITYQSPGATSDGDTSILTSGTAGIVRLPFSPVLALAAPFTAEAWLDAAQTAVEQCPLACVDAGGTRSGWLIYMDGQNPGSYNFRMYNKNGANTSLNISSPANGITAGQFYHVAVVYDGTNGYIYINGQLANSAAPSGFVPNDSGDLSIGGRSDAGFLFQGAEDEVAIYTNALSATTILAHYQAGTNPAPATPYSQLVLQSSPILYYRLDEPAYTAPPESSDPVANNYGASGGDDNGSYLPGCFPGTVPGPNVKGFPTNVACHFALEYGGFVDIVDPSSSLNVLGPVTLTAWIQGSPANINNFQSYAGRGDASYRGDVDQSGNVHFADGPNPDATGTFVNDGNWHFIAGTWDGANEKVYIDGALNQVQSAASGIAGDTLHFAIGGDGQYSPTGGRIFNGNVSQVAVFGTALSAATILSLYDSAQVKPFITQQPASSSTIVQFTSGKLSVTANGSPTLGYQWYDGATALTNAGDYAGVNTSTLTITANSLTDAGAYTVVVTNAYGSITSSVATVAITQAPAILSNLSTNPVALYAGNEVIYNIGAVGLQPLTYRWFNGASLVSGVTSSNYTFGAKSGTNLYSVIISNSFGVVTSAVATVIGQAFVSPPGGFAVNFSVGPGSANPYQGLGAYADLAANTNWNLIPAASGTPTGLTFSSGSNATLVTMTLDWGFNNSGLPNANDPNGSVGYLVGTEDAVNPGAPGIGTTSNPKGEFIVNDLPPGHYSLYLYSANFNGDRGSVFNLAPVNGGFPDGGTNFTENGIVLGLGNDSTATPQLADTDNYIVFHNVVPDVTGTITGTFVPLNPNPLSGNTQEASFNGLQAVLQQLSAVQAGGTITLTWSGGALYSAPTVNGPWSLLAGPAGSSSTNLPTVGTSQFFLVY